MKHIDWWYTEIGEAEKHSLLTAFDDKRFSLGSGAAAYEARLCEWLDVPFAVATTSGTTALTMALLAAGVGPGDEVIVPDLPWIGTAQAAAVLGARVVLADCLPDATLIDPDQVRRKITPRTKAIIPVHTNGRPCALAELKTIAEDSGAILIENACKALGSKAEGRYLGTLGEMGCFSHGLVSLVSMGHGGTIVTHDRARYEQLRLIRDHGVVRSSQDGSDRYDHLAANYKISDLLCAIGLAQLERVEEKSAHLRRIYRRYVDGLAASTQVRIIPVDIESGNLPLLVEVRTRYREQLAHYLAAQDVATSKFHPPLHQARYLKAEGAFPNASRFADEGIVLPCGPSQPLENVDRCVELIHRWEQELQAPRRARA